MKKIILLVSIAFALAFTIPTQAQNQKLAYVDTEYVLNNIPEYLDAQEELNEYSRKWQEELEAKFKEVEEMYKDYKAEAVLLPEDLKAKREDEIIKKEQAAKDLQRSYFGPEGELFKKRQELIQPIQEKVFGAIEEIASMRNFGFVFDKAAGVSILYTNPKFDISDDVLDEVGSVMQTVRREDRKR